MLIEKPRCSFKNCRYCFDGNCYSADKYENCKLTDLHSEIAKLTVDLDNAKSEVAREIFEEIKRVIGEQYENYVFDNLEIEGVKQDAIIAFVDAMKRHFFAIEKKYTEGNDERSD